ncbi:MAG: GYD domain-containing protein [Pirellulaceae bacterium]
MATFISTIKFTEQGIQNIKDTCKRANTFKATAKKKGVKVQEVFWTLGRFDGLLVFDAPDEETATALMLDLGSQGNVHTQTARAYTAPEMEGILAKMDG